ncbi:hypothetical protein [Bacillus alkalicola]|nr:hypothetical protein [Bacillus alkalicola]
MSRIRQEGFFVDDDHGLVIFLDILGLSPSPFRPTLTSDIK